jgi:hypothetical protein
MFIKELLFAKNIRDGCFFCLVKLILENIPHALDVHAQRVLKYNFILIYDFTIIETGRFNDQNLSGKTSRIIKFSKTVSSYTVFEVD